MNPSVLKRVPVKELASRVRNKNFEEVVLGYTLEEAMAEASRCLECKHQPCVSGCPVNINIPAFIHHVKSGAIEEAYKVISEDNGLPAVCGRVCPQENQCEGKCVRGIKGEAVAIGRLERFVADYMEADHFEEVDDVATTTSQPSQAPTIKAKVAVVGSGPAGLSCAAELAKAGVEVTVFEALHRIGGVLTYGIPEFRLPKALIAKEQMKLEAMGVTIQTDTLIGKSYTIDQLKEAGYKAVFVGSGAGLPKFMGIPGEQLNGVYSANEYLTRVNLMKAYRADGKTPVKRGHHVVVVGGGNVAMDAARTAKRLGAESVHIVYRRSEEELPARREEVHHAKEEGVEFATLMSPVEIIGEDFKAKEIICQEMTLGEPDASGRRRPIALEGSLKTMTADVVIIAIGQTPNPLIKMTTPGIETFSWGGIKVDETTMATNIQGLYAGGDAVTGAATVIHAMGAGKTAAKEIVTYIKALA